MTIARKVFVTCKDWWRIRIEEYIKNAYNSVKKISEKKNGQKIWANISHKKKQSSQWIAKILHLVRNQRRMNEYYYKFHFFMCTRFPKSLIIWIVKDVEQRKLSFIAGEQNWCKLFENIMDSPAISKICIHYDPKFPLLRYRSLIFVHPEDIHKYS